MDGLILFVCLFVCVCVCVCVHEYSSSLPAGSREKKVPGRGYNITLPILFFVRFISLCLFVCRCRTSLCRTILTHFTHPTPTIYIYSMYMSSFLPRPPPPLPLPPPPASVRITIPTTTIKRPTTTTTTATNSVRRNG